MFQMTVFLSPLRQRTTLSLIKEYVNNIITNSAAVEKVWKALVNPEQAKKYMFGRETVSDYKVGDSLQWRTCRRGGKTLH